MELKVDLRQEGEKTFCRFTRWFGYKSNKEFKEKVNSVQGVKKNNSELWKIFHILIQRGSVLL